MTENKNKNILKEIPSNQKGQVSIFLAVITIVVITLIAFIINVGLFVKAKINLQNATDAGAWSGAAAQARRLSNIGHLNWEMRNTYKEWMFKYYVLGQHANTKTHSLSGPKMDFRLKKFDPAANTSDRFNVPSVCIHFGSSHNICNVYDTPGLPRFPIAGLPNVSEDFEAAIDSFVEQKSKNCIIRALYNFAAAQNYAYSIGNNVSFQDVPTVAGYRKGAWVEAIELALRMRSLESIVNREPVEDMCLLGNCTNNVNTMSGGDVTAYNERPLGAFKAIFKNLGGGSFKSSDPTTAIAANLRVTELTPRSVNIPDNSLDQLFVPTSGPPQHPNPREKKYLNLRPMLFNFVTFFNTFVPQNQNLSETGITTDDIDSEGACKISRTAIPVPGYIMGFYKDPRVNTYYALKATTRYKGLLNPFAPREGIEIKAYAAAKPYGGRIGPMLVQPPNFNTFDVNIPRVASSQITSQYILGFDTSTSGYDAGLPIPMNTTSKKFYLSEPGSDTSYIGGTPSSDPDRIKFGVPNLIYQLPTGGNLRGDGATGFYDVSTKYPNSGPNQALPPSKESAGLFNSEQFFGFKNNLTSASGFISGSASINSQATIRDAIKRARGVTNYDMANYLVPTHLDLADEAQNLEASTTLKKITGEADDIVAYYGPIMRPGTIYPNANTVRDVMTDYLGMLEAPIEQYLDALKDVSQTLVAEDALYQTAADGIYNLSDPPGANPSTIIADQSLCPSASLAAKINFLFRSNTTTASCGILPLSESINTYITSLESGNADFYYTTYTNPLNYSNVQISTAFSPGIMQGSNEQAEIISPFTNSAPGTYFRRNFYSTKIVSMKRLLGEHGELLRDSYSEGAGDTLPDGETNMQNVLEATDLNEFSSGAGFQINGITDETNF